MGLPSIDIPTYNQPIFPGFYINALHPSFSPPSSPVLTLPLLIPSPPHTLFLNYYPKYCHLIFPVFKPNSLCLCDKVINAYMYDVYIKYIE